MNVSFLNMDFKFFIKNLQEFCQVIPADIYHIYLYHILKYVASFVGF